MAHALCPLALAFTLCCLIPGVGRAAPAAALDFEFLNSNLASGGLLSQTTPIVSLLIQAFEPLDASELDGIGSSVPAAVPEPALNLMLGLGLAAAALRLRRGRTS